MVCEILRQCEIQKYGTSINVKKYKEDLEMHS